MNNKTAQTQARILTNRRYRRRLNDEYSGKPEFESTLKEMLTALDQRFFQLWEGRA